MNARATNGERAMRRCIVFGGCWVLAAAALVGCGGPGPLSSGPGGSPLATTGVDKPRERLTLAREMKYLPDRFRTLESVRVAELVSSPVYRAMEKADPVATKKRVDRVLATFPGGLEATAVERMTSDPIRPWAVGGGLTVFTLKSPVTADAILTKMPQAPDETVTAGGHTVYRFGKQAVCVPEPNIVVAGEWKLVRPALERNAETSLDPRMQAALAQVDFANTAVDINCQSSGDAGVHYSSGGPWGGFNPAAVLPQRENDILINQVTWDDKYTAETLVLRAPGGSNYPTARMKADAETFRDRIGHGAQFPEVRAIMAETQVRIDGDRLTATGVVKLDQVPALVKNGLMWRE